MIKEKVQSPAKSLAKRLVSIDALRGVAALSVVLYHAVGHSDISLASLRDKLSALICYPISFGYTGVYLFFVISGFCIHLQWAKKRAAGIDTSINFFDFWRRRLYRLYPPYFIAVMLYLTLYALRGHLQFNLTLLYDAVMHLTMLHNLDRATVYSINSAFWTLAIEEQLYLAYFLLLFLRARWGWLRVLTIALTVRVVWFFACTALKDKYQIDIPISESAAAHWFTWTLGAIGVEASLGLITLPRWCRNGWAAFVALLGAVALTEYLPWTRTALTHDIGWLALDPLWGIGFFLLVNWAVSSEVGWQLNMPVLVKRLATVGLFSYSLYLTHQFTLLHGYLFHFIKLPHLLFALLILTPLALGFAWTFFRYAEKPFIAPPSDNKPLQPAGIMQERTTGD